MTAIADWLLQASYLDAVAEACGDSSPIHLAAMFWAPLLWTLVTLVSWVSGSRLGSALANAGVGGGIVLAGIMVALPRSWFLPPQGRLGIWDSATVHAPQAALGQLAFLTVAFALLGRYTGRPGPAQAGLVGFAASLFFAWIACFP